MLRDKTRICVLKGVRMKRILGVLVSVFIGSMLFSTHVFASPEGKGNRIYLKKLSNTCKLSGFEMAQKHTQEEWKAIYEAGLLNAEMESLCPGARDFKASDEKYVNAFFYAFASDSGKVVAG